MKYYDHCISYGEGFSERIGEPEKFDAALGRVIVSFSFLERSLSNVITLFLGVENAVGEVVVSEMSFKNLVNLFSSLLRLRESQDLFGSDGESALGRVAELVALSFRAEQRRNQIIHSGYALNRFRIKTTAKAKHGLRKDLEELSPAKILDVSDFITSVAMSIEEFPVILGVADSVSGTATSIAYKKDGNKIASFVTDLSAET